MEFDFGPDWAMRSDLVINFLFFFLPLGSSFVQWTGWIAMSLPTSD